MSYAKKHLSILGHRVRDRVTGIEGVVVSVAFDLYGCVQAIVNRGVDKDGKVIDSVWCDVARLTVLTDEPVMPAPDFSLAPTPQQVAAGEKGPAEKPAGRY